MSVILVALGGAFGAVMRYLIVNMIGSREIFGLSMPYGTMIVNIAGSFCIGVFVVLLSKYFNYTHNLYMFVVVGVLGGFTTFSAFSLDVIQMMQRGEVVYSIIYIVLSVLFSIISVFAGMVIIKAFF